MLKPTADFSKQYAFSCSCLHAEQTITNENLILPSALEQTRSAAGGIVCVIFQWGSTSKSILVIGPSSTTLISSLFSLNRRRSRFRENIRMPCCYLRLIKIGEANGVESQFITLFPWEFSRLFGSRVRLDVLSWCILLLVASTSLNTV